MRPLLSVFSMNHRIEFSKFFRQIFCTFFKIHSSEMPQCNQRSNITLWRGNDCHACHSLTRIIIQNIVRGLWVWKQDGRHLRNDNFAARTAAVAQPNTEAAPQWNRGEVYASARIIPVCPCGFIHDSHWLRRTFASAAKRKRARESCR